MRLHFIMVFVTWSFLACSSPTQYAAPSNALVEENVTTRENAPRIAVAEAYKRVKSGEALLVCGYDSEEKCSTIQLEGSISLMEFESKIQSIRKDQEIIFFCT